MHVINAAHSADVSIQNVASQFFQDKINTRDNERCQKQKQKEQEELMGFCHTHNSSEGNYVFNFFFNQRAIYLFTCLLKATEGPHIYEG